MIKFLYLSLASTLFAISAIGTPIAYEPFSYNVGELLCPLPATPQRISSESNYWISGTSASLVSDAAVVSGSLSYPGLAASTGNSVTNGSATTPTQQSSRYVFNTTISNDTLYVSYLMRIDSLGATFQGAPGQQGLITAMG